MDYNQSNYGYNYSNHNAPPPHSNWDQDWSTHSNCGLDQSFYPNGISDSYSNDQPNISKNGMYTEYPLPYPNKDHQGNYGQDNNLTTQNNGNYYGSNNFQRQYNYENRNQMPSKRTNSIPIDHMMSAHPPKYNRYENYNNSNQMSNASRFDLYNNQGIQPYRHHSNPRRDYSNRNSQIDSRHVGRNHTNSRDNRRQRNPSNRVPIPPSRSNFGKPDSDDKETVRLAYNLFRPPTSEHIRERKINSLRSWQKEVLNELETTPYTEDQTVSKSTTLLSDVAQRVLKMNMVFLYAFVEEIPPCESDIFKEFYGEWNKTAVLSEMYMDDIFISQGIGSDRMAARESACQGALGLFKEGDVNIFPVVRTYNDDPLEIFCVSTHETLGKALAASQKYLPFIRSPWRDTNKKVPWQQTKGHVNATGPKGAESMPYEQAVGEFFLLIDNGRTKDKQPSSMLNNSAQFNRVYLDYQVSKSETTGNNRSYNCTILLHNHEYATGSGPDSNSAKNSAANYAVKELQKTQPLLKMRLQKTRSVTRSELEGYAGKLADEKGYVPNEDFKRFRMKEEHLAKLEEDSEAYFVNYVNEIKEDLHKPDGDDTIDVPLKFGDEFTHDEKMAIHKAARRLQLTSKPYGPPKKSHLLVSSHYSLLKTKKLLLSRGHTGRYELVSKGSADVSNLLQREETSSSEFVMLIPPYNDHTDAS